MLSRMKRETEKTGNEEENGGIFTSQAAGEDSDVPQTDISKAETIEIQIAKAETVETQTAEMKTAEPQIGELDFRTNNDEHYATLNSTLPIFFTNSSDTLPNTIY